MPYPVTYHCPRCGTLHELERAGYLADKAVTPYPFEGWEYVRPDEAIEDADGVRFVCGEAGTTADNEDDGCGEPFYLSYVRFENGEEVDPPRAAEFVEISVDGGPRWPGGPRSPP